jgi:TPR repeat protein
MKRTLPPFLFLTLMIVTLLPVPAFADCPNKEARAKSPAAAYALGKAYDEGECGLPLDEAQAEQWYRKAATKGYTPAEYALGRLYFNSGKNYPEAKTWFLKAAEKGDGAAALKLGFLNAEAHYAGLTPNHAEAEKWFLKAAEENIDDAQFRLGNFYANTRQPRDYDKAYMWLKKAAEGGNRTAMFDLAMLIRMGQGKEKSESESLKWMIKAAEADVVGAQTSLIQAYSTGEGAPQNSAEAMKWILKLADDPRASNIWINRAADIFYSGWLNIPADYPRAFAYYERAAAKNDPHARGRLGEMYTYGLGVKKDPVKAAAYFKNISSFLPEYNEHKMRFIEPSRTAPVPVFQKH